MNKELTMPIAEREEEVETNDADRGLTLTLLDLLGACVRFLLNPESQETQNQFEEIKQKMQIRTYLPLKQKENAIERAMTTLNVKTEESQAFGTAQELALMFHGLLSYVINLDMSDVDFYITEDVYDAFTASGFFDYILSFCHLDFYRLEQQYKGVYEYMNVKALVESINKMSGESMEKLVKEFEEFRMNQNPDILKYYAKLSETNDPILNTVAESIKQKAYEAVQDQTE